MLLLLPPQSAGLFSVDALGERVEYLVSMAKEGLEALYCLSMHDLLFKMVPLNNSLFFVCLFFIKTSSLIVQYDTALSHIPCHDLMNVSTRFTLLKFSYITGLMRLFGFGVFK